MKQTTAALLYLLCIPAGSIAQEAQVLASDAAPVVEDAEEIVVTGQRLRFELRLRMQDAERAVYNLFNELNDEARFEIHCEMRPATGTRLESLVCQPEFERRALAAEGQDYLAAYRAFMEPYAQWGTRMPEALSEYSPISTAPPAASVIASQQRALQRKMREVADGHPEFVEALVRFVEAKGRYGTASEIEETP